MSKRSVDEISNGEESSYKIGKEQESFMNSMAEMKNLGVVVSGCGTKKNHTFASTSTFLM